MTETRQKCHADGLGYQRCALWAKWEVLKRGEWLPVCGTHRRALAAWNYESRPSAPSQPSTT